MYICIYIHIYILNILYYLFVGFKNVSNVIWVAFYYYYYFFKITFSSLSRNSINEGVKSAMLYALSITALVSPDTEYGKFLL
jgi:predicted transporter